MELLNYQTFKNGEDKEWVTFIHGAGGSSTIWYKQLKDFRQKYNVLLIDLRGHGKSKPTLSSRLKSYNFTSITKDILEVLEHLSINRSHFVGISLGTILIRQLAEMNKEVVQSMVLGGAIIKLNFRSKILMKLGLIGKNFLPFIWLYKFFAYTIMPRRHHKHSRLLFIREAKKICQKEFLRWFKIVSELNPLLKYFRAKDINIPTLYIMGAEDYLFLPAIKEIVQSHKKTLLEIIPNCGHVVNVDKPDVFNTKSLAFLDKQ